MRPVDLQPSPLQIDSYYVKEIACSVKHDFVDKQGAIAEVSYPQLQAFVSEVRSQDDPRRWRFELAVSSDDDLSSDFPYSLRITMVGFFTVRESWPESKVELLAKINGPSLLFSAAREALVLITSRSGYPSLVLPSVFFSPQIEPPPRQAESSPSPEAGGGQPEPVKKAGERKRSPARKATKKG